jgi:hypothetical protein
MRLIVLQLMVAALTVTAAPPPSSAVSTLPPEYYDIGEAVFRDCMAHSDRGSVYHLSYSTNDSTLPPDFMSRFEGQSPLVRSSSDGITVVSNRWLTDKITKQPAARLSIREVRLSPDSAVVQLHYVASSTGLSARYYLVRSRGKWKVKDSKTEWIACSF